jgi:hypothetical protein
MDAPNPIPYIEQETGKDDNFVHRYIRINRMAMLKIIKLKKLGPTTQMHAY